MKPINQITIKTVLLFCMALFVADHASAQSQEISSEFGVYQVQNPDEPCVPPGFYAKMQEEIAVNVARLAAEGNLISSQHMILPPQNFDWPLTHETSFLGNEYYFIQNYIDHAPAAGVISDYMCGTRSYDLPNYDHDGTDIVIGPYWWKMMNDMKVRVIAAAPGQILFKVDGNPDSNCAMGGGTTANSITILHEDGTRSLYMHMKTGSVTSKQVGDLVSTGEYLGYVASSGSSTAPHLHFELQDSSGNVIDPWFGPCNPALISRWNSQKPYPNSGIMSILTMSGFASAAACPAVETVPISNHFDQGAAMRIEVHLRDLVPNTICTTKIYNPSGTIVHTDPDTVGNSFSAAAWFGVNYTIPNNSPIGTYKVLATYQGKQAAHYFTVGCPGAYNLSGAITGYKGYITGDNITTTQTIAGSSANNIWYEAEDYIQANVGFRATSGSRFRARIDNCAENSAIARVETNHANTFALKANPSVVNDFTKLSLEIPQSGPVSILVYDLTGRIVKTLITNQNFEIGMHEFELNVAEFTSGVYICKGLSGESKSQCKIVVQH